MKGSNLFSSDVAEAVRVGSVRQGVSDVVYAALLDALHAGQLEPGQRINDIQVAEQLGVSRTPVREALQRLRDIGVIETAPNRFTRVSVVSWTEAHKAVQVWEGLFGVLLDEVIDRMSPAHVRRMSKSAAKFAAAREAHDPVAGARANFEFYDQSAALSSNPFLLRGLETVVHVVWLSTVVLVDRIDSAALAAAHQALLVSLEAKDLDGAKAAVHAAVLSIRAADDDPKED